MQQRSPRDGPATAPPSASPAGAAFPGKRSGAGSASVLPPMQDDAGRRPRPTPVPAEHPAADTPAGPCSAPRTVGRYLVSPLVKLADNGWFASSVSIRSGRGSATTDRVLRLTRLFRCAQEAAIYAHAEALNWIAAPQRPLAAA